MKRCPQCEFIYEDDQSLCDMDGVLLVFDSRALPNLHALTTVSPKASAKRKRAVPAFATLILALVLGMVYYVSTQLNTAQNMVITESSIPAVSLPSANQPAPPIEIISAPEALAPRTDKIDAAKPAAAAKSSSTLAPVTKSTAKTSPAKPATEEKKKDESKVGSILKKTGRILKKPFKF